MCCAIHHGIVVSLSDTGQVQKNDQSVILSTVLVDITTLVANIAISTLRVDSLISSLLSGDLCRSRFMSSCAGKEIKVRTRTAPAFSSFVTAFGDSSPCKHAKSTQIYLENVSSASLSTSFDDLVPRKKAITWSLVNRLRDDAILLKYTKISKGIQRFALDLQQ